MHAGVRAAGADQAHRGVEAKQSRQPILELALNCAAAALSRPTGEAGAVVGNVQPPAHVANLDAAIGEIEDVATGEDAAPLEAGNRAAFPPWCPTPRMLVHECWVIVEHVPHPAGVVLPIGGKPPHSAGPHPGGHKVGETGVQQSTLVVPCLVPWIREEHPDAIHPGTAEDESEACDSVRLDDPHVTNVLRHE